MRISFIFWSTKQQIQENSQLRIKHTRTMVPIISILLLISGLNLFFSWKFSAIKFNQSNGFNLLEWWVSIIRIS